MGRWSQVESDNNYDDHDNNDHDNDDYDHDNDDYDHDNDDHAGYDDVEDVDDERGKHGEVEPRKI